MALWELARILRVSKDEAEAGRVDARRVALWQDGDRASWLPWPSVVDEPGRHDRLRKDPHLHRQPYPCGSSISIRPRPTSNWRSRWAFETSACSSLIPTPTSSSRGRTSNS